jgi:hypothetical protein
MRRRHLVLTGVAATSALVAAVGFALPTAASAAAGFIPGTAVGTAQALSLSPHNGGFAYTMTIGSAIAQYRATLAQASSSTLDLGLIGTSLTAEGCDGSPPPVKRSQLPQPLIAESDHGNTSKSADSVGQSSGGFLAAGGHQTVAVTTVPTSRAGFTGGTVGITGLVEASGMSTLSSAELIPGKARVATATATLGRLALLGGAVVFDDLRWTATQRTGTDAGMTGGFTVGAVEVAGQSVPASGDALKQAFDAVNAALAQSGIHLDVPAPRKAANDTLVVPPLTIGIDNSTLGATVVNPLLTAAQPAMEQVEKALLGFSCKFGTPLLLRDIALASVDGTGGLDLSFGGVTAGTDDATYANPFGTPTLGTGTGSPLSPGGNPTAGTATTGAGGPGTAPPVTAGVGPAAGVAPQLAGSATRAQSCATTSPAHWPSCSDGAAVAVGLLGLLAVGLVGGGDWLAVHRRRRLPQLDL